MDVGGTVASLPRKLREGRYPAASMARLILIRHAESVANAERRFTHGPHELLSERGRAEARDRGLFVRERFAPEALYCSPFARAIETARLIGEALGLEPQRVDDLREQDFGRLRGQPYAVLDRDPERARSGRWHYRPPGGETLEEVTRRAGPALDGIAARHAGREVLVVSHGAVMAGLRVWIGAPPDAAPIVSANAGGYLLTRSGDRYAGPFPLEDSDSDS